MGKTSKAQKIISFMFPMVNALAFSCFVVLQVVSCSGDTLKSNRNEVKIPIHMKYATRQSLGLAPVPSSPFSLDTMPSGIVLSVANCSSGNEAISFAVSSFLNLFVSDQNCIVKLDAFTIGSRTYVSEGPESQPFRTWMPGDLATFQNIDGSLDLVQVYVVNQVSPTGIQSTDYVTYGFTDLAEGEGTTVVQAHIGITVSLTGVKGEAYPNFTIADARFLTINSDGSASLSFTLECGNVLTGSSFANYACDSQLLQSEIDYVLVPDIYSQGALNIGQANAAFLNNTPAAVGNLIVPPGSLDLNSNSVPNGGFYTSNAAPLVTGATPILQGGLNSVLIIRHKDAQGIPRSYRYFYIDAPTPAGIYAKSACGTFFAGGSGTPVDPYKVNDRYTLSNVSSCTNSSYYFIQTQNIDLAGSAWSPIVLYGQYNGNGNIIDNLTINNASNSASLDGLFSTVSSGASISNLSVESINISSVGLDVGGIAAVNAGSISNCLSDGSITSSSANVGGLVGSNLGSITFSSSTVTIH